MKFEISRSFSRRSTAKPDKVEKAVDVRKSGGTILIVHESDFWDAVADNK